MRKGFTLIELLAVIVVFITISTLVMSILVSVLRGNNKTNAINGVAANGDYAMSQIQKSIRSAASLQPTFTCGTVDAPSSTKSITLSFPDSSTIIYSCVDGSGNPTLSSNSAALVDKNTITVSSCQFTCGQDAIGGYPILGIDFSLQQKSSSSFVEQKAGSSPVEFKTSVVMRNQIR